MKLKIEYPNNKKMDLLITDFEGGVEEFNELQRGFRLEQARETFL